MRIQLQGCGGATQELSGDLVKLRRVRSASRADLRGPTAYVKKEKDIWVHSRWKSGLRIACILGSSMASPHIYVSI